MFKAKVDLIYILNCPELQEVFQNIVGNSIKKNTSVYYSSSLLVMLLHKTEGFDFNMKGDYNLQK